MGRKQRGPEVRRIHLNPGDLAERGREGVLDPTPVPTPDPILGKVQPRQAAPGGVAERSDPPAKRTRQGPEERHRLLLAMAGYEPLEALGLDRTEDRRRNPGRDPVVRLARRETVGELHRNPGDLDLVRKFPLGWQAGARPDHVGEGEAEVLRVGERFEPAAKAPRACDVRGQAHLEEAGPRVVADQEVLPPRPAFDLAHGLQHGPVAVLEGGIDDERARRQPFGDEDVARRHRVHRSETHPPPGHEGEAEQHHPLEGHDLAPLGVEVGLEVLAGHELACGPLDPLRADPGPRRGRRRPWSRRAPRPRSSAPRTA